MVESNVVNEFYARYNEEERLADRPGQVEYATTMKYIHKYLKPGMKIAEIGAGTGKYSLALAIKNINSSRNHISDIGYSVGRRKHNCYVAAITSRIVKI